MPKISIITPLYNKAPYIEETIRSVLAQTHRDWEMIIIDNGSTDGGDELVARQLKALSLQYSIEIQDEKAANCQLPTEHLTSSDTLSSTLNLPLSSSFPSPIAQLPYPTSDIPSPISHLRLLKYAAVKGPGAARNEGLRHATGEWVLFLDADDLIEPDYLENLLTCVANHPEADVVAGGWKEFQDSLAECIVKRPIGVRNIPLKVSAIAFCPWAVHAAIIRRKNLISSCQWLPELDHLPSEDTAFWFRILQDSIITIDEGNGALYRKGIEGNRDQAQDAQVWLQAMKTVTDSNMLFLRMRGNSLSRGHLECLLRLYEGIFVRFRGQREGAKEALTFATEWMNQIPWRKSFSTPGLFLRKLLGIQKFQSICLFLRVIERNIKNT